MNIDIDKIKKTISCKKVNVKNSIDEQDINFMRYIYNSIINSECYESVTYYLAGIHELSVTDVKFLQRIYYNYFATDEERKLFINETVQTSKSSGFANFSIITSLLILIGSFGILVAFILYNL